MGSKEGAAKVRAYMLEQYGSLENYKEAMRKLGASGGSTPREKHNFLNPEIASKAGKRSGIVRRIKAELKQEITRINIHEES